MGPNEKEGKDRSSGTGSSDWVKTDWVILNRHTTGSSWSVYTTGSSWADYANVGRLELNTRPIRRVNGYATDTHTGSSWTGLRESLQL